MVVWCMKWLALDGIVTAIEEDLDLGQFCSPL